MGNATAPARHHAKNLLDIFCSLLFFQPSRETRLRMAGNRPGAIDLIGLAADFLETRKVFSRKSADSVGPWGVDRPDPLALT
jgi:hypothetical protein